MSRKQPAPRTGAATQPLLWAGAADEPAGSAAPSCPVQPERDVRVKRAQRGQIEERLTRLERRADTIVALLQQLLDALRPQATKKQVKP